MDEKIIMKCFEIKSKDLYGLFHYIKINKLFDTELLGFITGTLIFSNEVIKNDKNDKNLESNINDIKKRLLNEREVEIFNHSIKEKLLDKCFGVNNMVKDFKKFQTCHCNVLHNNNNDPNYNCNCEMKNKKKYIFSEIDRIKEHVFVDYDNVLLSDIILYYRYLGGLFNNIGSISNNTGHKPFKNFLMNKIVLIIDVKNSFLSDIILSKSDTDKFKKTIDYN